jgi:hypothetical protein
MPGDKVKHTYIEEIKIDSPHSHGKQEKPNRIREMQYEGVRKADCEGKQEKPPEVGIPEKKRNDEVEEASCDRRKTYDKAELCCAKSPAFDQKRYDVHPRSVRQGEEKRHERKRK